MAIIKMQKVRAGKPYGLKAILDYIQNPAKTDDGKLVSAKDCLLESAYQQMHLVKQDYLQMHGRQYVHIIQSFSISDELTGEMAHEIGQKLLGRFKGFQAVVATHTDRLHLHNHIVLNSVNFESGLKWQQSKQDLQALKDLSDQLCRDYGLSVIEKGKGWRSYGENKANYKGNSWKQRLAMTVAEAVNVSASREEFLHYLKGQGIEAEMLKDKVLFILPDGKKCGSDKLLSYGDFTKENLDNVIKYNGLTLADALSNPAIMFEAVSLASELLGSDNSRNLEHKYLHDLPLSALEGQALKEAILKLRDGSRTVLNKIHPDETKSNQPPYLLLTIDEALQIFIEERQHSQQYEAYDYNNDYFDDEELEI